MATRREARERALGLAYESEQRATPVAAIIDALPAPPDDYAVELASGAEDHRDEIDGLLGTYAEHWSVDRMPAIDRSLLRIATFELGWRPLIPTAVIVTEAVELAKQYSTKDSGRFVNGLLSRLAGELRAPGGVMPDHRALVAASPATIELPIVDEKTATDRPWVVIVWNDPVNLMSYVVLVLQKIFGYSREKATSLMLQIHNDGRAMVADGGREECEGHVSRLHARGLWATLERTSG